VSARGRHQGELIGQGHAAFVDILGRMIKNELKKRKKLMQYNTVDDAVELLKNSKNVLVLTGAGVRDRFRTGS